MEKIMKYFPILTTRSVKSSLLLIVCVRRKRKKEIKIISFKISICLSRIGREELNNAIISMVMRKTTGKKVVTVCNNTCLTFLQLII
jgi:hypothetical protein